MNGKISKKVIMNEFEGVALPHILEELIDNLIFIGKLKEIIDSNDNQTYLMAAE
jgi:hypothetical protein